MWTGPIRSRRLGVLCAVQGRHVRVDASLRSRLRALQDGRAACGAKWAAPRSWPRGYWHARTARWVDGFSLHAAVRCDARDRHRLEQPCRDVTPASAVGRTGAAERRRAGGAQPQDPGARASPTWWCRRGSSGSGRLPKCRARGFTLETSQLSCPKAGADVGLSASWSCPARPRGCVRDV